LNELRILVDDGKIGSEEEAKKSIKSIFEALRKISNKVFVC